MNPVTGAVTPAPTPGVDWSGCDLSFNDFQLRADLSGANLTSANLTGAWLSGVDAQRATLAFADLGGAAGLGMDFTDANLRHATLTDGDLADSGFVRADFSYASLTSSILEGTSLSYANLSYADFNDITNLYNAELDYVNFTGADVTGSDFSGAYVAGAFGCQIVGWPVDGVAGYVTVNGCLTYGEPYTVSPFRNPVDNPPVINVATAGKTVAFRFTVTDGYAPAYAAPVTNLTAVTPTTRLRTCSTTVQRDPIEWYSKGGLPLINLGEGKYRFNFATKPAWAGTCRGLRIDLGDGVQHVAIFKFLP